MPEFIHLSHEECDHIWTEEFVVQFCWLCGAPRSRPKEAPASAARVHQKIQSLIRELREQRDSLPDGI